MEADDRSCDDQRKHFDAIERYSQLPRSTREWLETRRKDDWERIDRALNLVDRLQDRGKFSLWIFGGLFSVFLGFSAFSDKIIEFANWWRGHP